MKLAYYFYKTCVDFDAAEEVCEIVCQDVFSFPEETFFHDPENQITKKEFIRLTGEKRKFDFYGFNKKLDIIFAYSDNEDIHYFYIK